MNFINLQELSHEWEKLWSKAETALERYAVYRIVLEQVKALAKEIEPEAIDSALEVLSSLPHGNTVYRKNGLKLVLQMRFTQEKSDELSEIEELIQIERAAATMENKAAIDEAIAQKEQFLSKLNEINNHIEQLTWNEEALKLEKQRQELLESLYVKRPTFSAIYRPE